MRLTARGVRGLNTDRESEHDSKFLCASLRGVYGDLTSTNSPIPGIFCFYAPHCAGCTGTAEMIARSGDAVPVSMRLTARGVRGLEDLAREGRYDIVSMRLTARGVRGLTTTVAILITILVSMRLTARGVRGPYPILWALDQHKRATFTCEA